MILNILLTGASGFLSRALLPQLSPICNLIDIYNYRNPELSQLSPNVEYDFLVDIGSPTPLNSDNTAATYNAHLNQVKSLYDRFSIRNTIFISSVSVFGSACGYISENSPYIPNSHYSNHKIMVEHVHIHSSPNTLTLISSGICGFGMSRIFLTRLLEQLFTTGYGNVTSINELFNGIYHVSHLSSYIVKQITSESVLSRKELVHSSGPLSWLEIKNLFETYIGQPLSLLGSTTDSESKIYYSENFVPRCTVRETLGLTFHDLFPDTLSKRIT